MPQRRMPTDKELQERYSLLDQNAMLDKISNWRMPNDADPFDEKKDEDFLAFLESSSSAYYAVLGEMYSRIKVKGDQEENVDT